MKDCLRKKIQPHGARLISSQAVLKAKRHSYELARKLLAQPHKITVYLRINDPYSYLLVQVLAEIELRYEVSISIHTIQQLRDDMYPEPEMWHDNAFIDAGHLANLYDLNWPEQSPGNSLVLVKQGTRRLLEFEASCLERKKINWHSLQAIFEEYWLSKPLTAALLADIGEQDALTLDRMLYANEESLKDKGHYMSAMLYYAGEWYWGLDRLDHLESRLNELVINRDDQPLEVRFNKTYIDFCRPETAQAKASPKLKKLVLYFSIRSPYSHIGLQQGMTLAKHYHCELKVKPILPMIMRGLSVPDTKKMYIFHDTKREAQKLGLDYGFVADPLGAGVERCYTLFSYAQSLGCEKEYLLNFAQAVNAQGIHSDTDEGLKIIVERSGMDWQKAKSLLTDEEHRNDWHGWAEENRQQMLALGSWGVPTFKYGDLVLWGQDRIGLIEHQMQKDLAKAE